MYIALTGITLCVLSYLWLRSDARAARRHPVRGLKLSTDWANRELRQHEKEQRKWR